MMPYDSDLPGLPQQTILIVDDNPTNIGVIADYLEDHGFIILVARDGESGISRFAGRDDARHEWL